MNKELYDHECQEQNAEKFWKWITTRDGIAVWKSANLSNLSASWSTPATIRKGDCEGQTGDEIIPYPKPTWQAESTPTIITDAARVEVFAGVEFKRFHVGIKRGYGFSFTLTTAASRRVEKAQEEAGEDSYHEFDYERQDAIIFKSVSKGSLAAYAAEKGWK